MPGGASLSKYRVDLGLPDPLVTWSWKLSVVYTGEKAALSVT
jgi:hypothetical protein